MALWGGLGGLSAGIGVHLGVQHHQVHVTVLGHHMVDAAEADIVGPAVAAHGPHGLLGQIFLILQDVARRPPSAPPPPEQQSEHPSRPGGLLVVPAVSGTSRWPPRQPLNLHGFSDGSAAPLADGILRVEEAVGKLGVVLKQGVAPRRGRGPGSPCSRAGWGAPPQWRRSSRRRCPRYMRSPNSWLSSLM